MIDTEKARTTLKERVTLSLGSGSVEMALKIVDEVCDIASDAGDEWEGEIREYYTSVTGANPFERPATRRCMQKARAVLMSRDVLNGREVKKRYDLSGRGERSESYSRELVAFEGWLSGLGMTEATVCTKAWRANVLFEYLERIGVESLADLDAETLVGFMSWLSGRYTPVGTNNILASLRGLFECPEVAAELTFNPSGLLANLRTPRHDKIPSVYSADEVSAALSTVDRDTDHGRALYLVIVLAAVYGLRSGDIRGLRIDDIDFRANSIGIVQHKTGAPLALPLVEAVKLPLLDYMANTRRECPYREVMIKHRGAAEPYTHLGNYSSDLRHAFESSGVELRGRKAGLHSLRHSLATGLLGSGVPANEISAVLGHRSLRSTQDYVWSDVEHLRIAALEV